MASQIAMSNPTDRKSCTKCGKKLIEASNWCDTCSWLLGVGRKNPTHTELVQLGLVPDFRERSEKERIPFESSEDSKKAKQDKRAGSIYNGDRLKNLFSHRN